MDDHQKRAAFTEALKKLSNRPFPYCQYWQLFNEFFSVTKELGLLDAGFSNNYSGSEPPSGFYDSYWGTVSALFWEHVVGGVITVGGDRNNFSLEQFRITDYGKKVLQEEICIYDPTGTVDWLKAQADGEIDAIVEQYYVEAMTCFRRGCLRAAVVLTGGAAERTFLNLARSFATYLGDAQGSKLDRTIEEGRSFIRVYNEFKKRFDTVRPTIEKTLGRDDIQEYIGSIISFIRKDRNDQGHPKGVIPEKDVVLRNISLFPGLYIICNQLIKYFENNKAE